MLQPTKNKLVVELIQKEKVTDSGIILTSADRDEVSRGTVLFTGPDCEDVQVGDIIVADWSKSTKFRHEDKELWIVTEENVVGIFDYS
jgi:co-chaperonin GroES (HSP10)